MSRLSWAAIQPREVARATYPVFVLATVGAGCLGILAVWPDGFEDLGWKVLGTVLIVVIASGLILSACQRIQPQSPEPVAQAFLERHSTER